MAGGVVTTKPPMTQYDWAAYVRDALGDEWHKREVVYTFSNGRQFKDSGESSGIYSGTQA